MRYDRSALISHPQAYLFKIAANVSASWAVRSSRSLPHSADWLAELVTESDPEKALSNEEAIAGILDGLPARAREILYLRFVEGLTYEEVAKELGVTERVIRRDLANAYASVRASLDESGRR